MEQLGPGLPSLDATIPIKTSAAVFRRLWTDNANRKQEDYVRVADNPPGVPRTALLRAGRYASIAA